MFKLNLVIFIMAIVAVAKGQQQLTNNNSTLKFDYYINFNRQRYVQTLQNFDTQMEIFKQSYADSLATINIQRDMLVDSIVQNEAKLNSLEILSDLSKECVTKYRSYIPTISETKTKINKCVSTASNEVPVLLSYALETRNHLEVFITITFDEEVNKCKAANYSPSCLASLISEFDDSTSDSQKTFATQMEKAQLSGEANIKMALDCSYTIHNKTTSAIAEANTLINNCLLGRDDCEQCS